MKEVSVRENSQICIELYDLENTFTLVTFWAPSHCPERRCVSADPFYRQENMTQAVKDMFEDRAGE